MPYKFNGKEFDEETGLYYYGARYMNPVASIWYGVDPLAEKYPNMGAYVYCAANPVKLIDPVGRDGVKVVDSKNKTITIKANYYVVTKPISYKKNKKDTKIHTLKEYTVKNIEKMNKYNKYLNKLNLKVKSGEYKGYTMKFDLSFY